MKLIHKYKSPNFNARKSKSIEFIIIHYTALNTASNSIQYLCSKKNKVSSHYLISKKGEIYNLVSEKKRAWHAGQSYWNGKEDINSASIGIELDYSPMDENNIFSHKLLFNLKHLLSKLMKKYNILPENILGHSDISPYRKIDPGKDFPWKILENKKIAFKVKSNKNTKKIKQKINQWFLDKNISSKKKKTLIMLDYIGYDIRLALTKSVYYKQLLQAYSNRHRLYKSYSYNKKKINNVIELHFFNILLTKLKK
tara:strand:- start:59 stop:820 length:762 start_codon:yes stop_codon:yes gene_type:complete